MNKKVILPNKESHKTKLLQDYDLADRNWSLVIIGIISLLKLEEIWRLWTVRSVVA